MKHKLILAIIALFCAGSGCNKAEEVFVVPHAKLIPPASSFGPDCILMKQPSDALAVQMSEGTYKPWPNEAKLGGRYTVFFLNPLITARVSRSHDIQPAVKQYENRVEKEWKGADGFNADLLSDVGAGGVCRDSSQGTISIFRFGNVVVELIAEDDQATKSAAMAFEAYYREVAMKLEP